MYFKKRNNTASAIILFLMSSGNLSLFKLESTSITVFYFVGPVIIAKWLINRAYINSFSCFLLVWSVINIIINLVFVTHIKILSILHFAFYIMAAISILSTFDFNEALILKTTKLVVYLNLVNILVTLTLYNLNFTAIPAFLGTYFDHGIIRYMGFTSEPSYLAMESTVCIIACLMLKKNISRKEKHNLLTAYILTILLSKTSLGLMSLFFVGMIWVHYADAESKNLKEKIFLLTFLIIIIVSCAGAIIYFSEYRFLSRLLVIFDLIFNSHSIQDFLKNLMLLDSSSWFRIGPLFLAIEDNNISSFTTWFGNGIGADSEYYALLTNSNTTIRGGFLQAGFYNHGIIALIMFLLSIFKKCKYLGTLNIIYLILCFTNCNISTQAFWFIVIIYVKVSELLEVEKI